MYEVQMYDSNTVLEFTVVDQDNAVKTVSGYYITARFEKPDGTIVEEDTEFLTNGADGKVLFISPSGFFDQDGIWYVQLKRTLLTETKYSDIVILTVNPNL